MTLEEIKNAIIELSNKVAKYSITPGIVANILEELRLKIKEIFDSGTSLANKLGDLSRLLTKNKTSAVDAINEIYTLGGGGRIEVDTAMSGTSGNAVQNKVIKAYVDNAFGKTNILTVRMQDEIDSHFDNYSVVNIMDGTDIVATILMNTHSSGTKGIIFQHGSGWRIVTEELGDIIGAGWSQVLEDMDSNSTPIGEGGGGDVDDSMQRMLAGMTPHILYEDTDGKYVVIKSAMIGAQNVRSLNMKKLICGTADINGICFWNDNKLEEIYPCFSGVIKSFNYAFESCTSLRKLDLSKVDFSQINNFYYAFDKCHNLTDEVLRTIDFEHMAECAFVHSFYECKSLVDISINAPNCTSFDSTFYLTSSLKTAYINFSSKCKTITEMFRASSVERIDMSDADFSGITSMGTFGYQCQKLVSLIGTHTEDEVINGNIAVFRGLKVSWSANQYGMAVNLERATLLAIVKGVADLSVDGTSATLTFAAREKNKLTSAEWQVAIDKGWTIA